MADSKGLDALATLCGGVRKAQVPTNTSSHIANYAASQFPPATVTNAQGPAPGATITQQPLMAAQTDRQTTAPLAQKPPTEHNHNPFLAPPQNLAFPWSQALAASNNPPQAPPSAFVDGTVGAALLAAAATKGETMQQLAYKQYIQAQVAAQAAAAQAAHYGSAAAAAAAAQAAAAARMPSSAAANHATAPAPGVPTSTTLNNAPLCVSNALSPSVKPSIASPQLSHQVVQPKKEPEIAPLPRNTTNPSSSMAHIKHSQTPLSIAPQEAPSTHDLQAALPATATSSDGGGGSDDKQQIKRAANRRSAQLSRKRKKKFIEELKEENNELRRKEQILRSIPDLIIAFDSAGKLGFVSESVSRILDFTPSELEGDSFWDRLCEESVKLLKAAFMDALAARKSDVDTSPLGSGVLELKLLDRDGTHIAVTMNGIVHVSGESPECVGSIRPLDDKRPSSTSNINTAVAFAAGTATATTTKRKISNKLSSTLSATAREVTSSSDNSSTTASVQLHPPPAKARRTSSSSRNGVRQAAQISDSESVVSESC